jgi:hypothetical protein
MIEQYLNLKIETVNGLAKSCGANRAVLKEVIGKTEIDEISYPDYLETEMEGGVIADSDRYTNADIKEYGLKKVKEWIERDHERLKEFGKSWWYESVKVVAKIYIPFKVGDKINYKIETIESGGLYGVDSDNEEDYFREIMEEELHAVISYLKKLNIIGVGKLIENCDITTR